MPSHLKDTAEYADEMERPEERLPVEWVEHDELQANEWNPNEMDEETRERLADSILDNGWTQPIVVTDHEGELIIVDGEQRWQAAEMDSIQTDDDLTPEGEPAGSVPIHYIEIDELRARISTVQHNRPRGFLDSNQFEDVLKEFANRDVLDGDLIDRVNVSERRAERMVEDKGVAEAVAEGRDTMDAPWEPVPRHELDAEELDDHRSEKVREAARKSEDDSLSEEEREQARAIADNASRVGWVLREDEYEMLLEVLNEDALAESFVEMCQFVTDNELEDDIFPDWIVDQLEAEREGEEIEDEDIEAIE